jgi:hypothetical protein
MGFDASKSGRGRGAKGGGETGGMRTDNRARGVHQEPMDGGIGTGHLDVLIEKVESVGARSITGEPVTWREWREWRVRECGEGSMVRSAGRTHAVHRTPSTKLQAPSTSSPSVLPRSRHVPSSCLVRTRTFHRREAHSAGRECGASIRRRVICGWTPGTLNQSEGEKGWWAARPRASRGSPVSRAPNTLVRCLLPTGPRPGPRPPRHQHILIFQFSGPFHSTPLYHSTTYSLAHSTPLDPTHEHILCLQQMLVRKTAIDHPTHGMVRRAHTST